MRSDYIFIHHQDGSTSKRHSRVGKEMAVILFEKAVSNSMKPHFVAHSVCYLCSFSPGSFSCNFNFNFKQTSHHSHQSEPNVLNIHYVNLHIAYYITAWYAYSHVTDSLYRWRRCISFEFVIPMHQVSRKKDTNHWIARSAFSITF